MTRTIAPRKRVVAPEATWRRRIPVSLLPLLVALRVRMARRHPALWETARLNMRFLLERTRPDADVDAAAVEYLRQMYWRAERRWRPELVTNQPVEGVERLLAARDPARGLILTFMHHANFDGAFASLKKAGLATQVIGAAFLFDDDTPEYMRQHVRVVELGATVLSAAEGYAGITRELERGGTIAIAPDVAGRTQVEFAGRTVLGSFGPARAAYETNSQVCVATYHRDPTAVARIRLSEVIEPRDFPDAHALLAEILRRHEAAILEWPEAHDRPMQRFGRVTDEDRATFGEATDFRPI